MESRCELAKGPVPPPLTSNQNEAKETYSYQPEKAKSLLRQAGLTLPLKAKLYLNQDKEGLSIVTFIKEDLAKVGIDLTLVTRDWSAFKEAINKGDADCFFLSWWADYPDIENFLFPTFHSKNFGAGGNRSFYKNQFVDQELERAQQTPAREERLAIYQQVQNRIVEEAPWVFLWHRKDFFVHQPWIKDFKLHPIYTMEKGTEIVLDERKE